MANKAAKIVASELLGLNVGAFTVCGKQYTVQPPMIKTLASAINYLSEVDFDGHNVSEAIKSIPYITDNILNGISCFICGDSSLHDELQRGTVDEIKNALETCMSMIGTEVFQCASLAKSIAGIAARQKL